VARYLDKEGRQLQDAYARFSKRAKNLFSGGGTPKHPPEEMRRRFDQLVRQFEMVARRVEMRAANIESAARRTLRDDPSAEGKEAKKAQLRLEAAALVRDTVCELRLQVKKASTPTTSSGDEADK
jgi:hypothetical protein